MTMLPWWQTGVIYQIAVASFADSASDGRGDIRGIIDKLDYLNDSTSSSLGIDAIWITPVNTSPMRDFGYDVADYYSIDPRFGTMDDLEELIEACHSRGIKVMMDLVLNHTSDKHPWFVESRSSRDDPRRDWYIWRDGRAPGKPPNRWVAVTEGSAWQLDELTGQYYYHTFLPFQPDLNWRNPEVKQAMFDVMRFWLDKGVDGFRLDLINFLYEDEALRDNPPAFGRRPYFWQRHIYDRSQPESVEAAREMRAIADSYPARALMGEVCADDPCETIAFLGEGDDALHLSFYLDFARRRFSARHFRASVDWLESNLPPRAWPCYYLGNHDLPRFLTRFGRGKRADARARVAATMLLTLRGTPIIYYGEEIGMPTSKIPKRRMRDPIGKMYWPLSVGRDGSRTPMQWTPKSNAGFTAGRPWLPVDPSHATRNVEAQEGDPGSLLNWYRRLIRLRVQHPELSAGDYRALSSVPHSVYAYVRERDSGAVVVFLNFASRSVSLPGPFEDLPQRRWRTLLSTHGDEGEYERLEGIRLHANEALILKAK